MVANRKNRSFLQPPLWKRTNQFLAKVPTLLALAILLTSCTRPTTVETIAQEGVLHVITRNGPTTYYEARDGAAGFEYELVKKFADDLGVDLRLRVITDLEEGYEILNQRFTHFAALGLSRQAASREQENLQFGQPYLTIQPLVIFRNGAPMPEKIDDLVGRSIMVPEHTAQADFLKQIKDARLPELEWQKVDGVETSELMALVEQGHVDIAIVNSIEYALHQAMYPQARASFALMEPLQIGWIFPPDEDQSVLNRAEEFLEKVQEDGTLMYLQEKYFGHVDQLNYVGARTLIRHINERLPKFSTKFQEVGSEFALDWRLLAAMGYQESHWRPYATSPTGVRGLMMLTRITAREMGVKNRLDPNQSIWGGAKYFGKIKSRISEQIREPDRTWMALAAYNVGYGHLQDARQLTQDQGFDPNKWSDVKEHLPLLQQKKWYEKTRFGYARGWEPVHYVQNIRRYYDVLAWMHPTEDQKRRDLTTELTLSPPEAPDNSDNIAKNYPALPSSFLVTPPML